VLFAGELRTLKTTMKTAIAALCCVSLLTPAAFGQVTPPPTDTGYAVNEAVVRQAARIDLHKKMADAQAAERKGMLVDAAKLYEDCLALLRKIGAGAEQEAATVIPGFVNVRLQLADQAMRRMDFVEADNQLARVLKEDPKNPKALEMRTALAKAKAESEGLMPSSETLAKLPEANQIRVRASTMVQDGKVLFEAGRYDEAEAKLHEAHRLDPNNSAAFTYLNSIAQQRHQQQNAIRENWSVNSLLAVDAKWNEKRDVLPVPNPYVGTNLVLTSKARQGIYLKLDRIRLEQVSWDGLPLTEVLKQLGDEAKKRDPEKRGLNFLANSYADPVSSGPPAIDPATGLPVANAAEASDVGTTIIKLALHDVTLHQVLDAITKVADHPLKYSIEDYAVVFTPKPNESPSLHTRWFKVDPNTFLQGLQGVAGFTFGTTSSGSSGGGQGGNSGGGRGGGGGRNGGGGGGGNNGNSGSGNGNDSSGSEYVGVSLVGGGAGGRRGNQQGGGGAGQAGRPGGAGGAGGQQGQGGGVNFLTQLSPVEDVITTVVSFFRTAGVDLAPPKNVFWNERSGMLMVRGTLQDLDIVEQAIQVLNMSPPQITIEAKFAEVTQDDNRSLGFDWLLGNTLMAGGRLGAQGGSAPSFLGNSTAANPNGVFPGPATIPGSGLFDPSAAFPSATDNRITSGLRNDAPALGTLTGILTDPQFRLVIRALDQRQGVDLLSAPKITTLSARQAQIKVVDVRSIVTDLDLSQTTGGASSGGVGNVSQGVVGSTVQPIIQQIELGPVLDVVPYVSADGYTVQMTIIPTIKEFVGYDLDTAKLFQAQAQSVGTAAANPLTTTTPLPIFRLRQVVTSAIVWDGQTVVLGGLISENVTRTKDKVPLLGDLPLAGRFFRSESSSTKKKNLLIFVTPTIIDPAGNRVHTPEDMPFAQSTIPPQKPVTQ
jgi:type II secretory pathway component GspD/PulD (secretin)/tetratricopeptide (TPR) repeat protein